MTEIWVNPEQLDILRHTVGLDIGNRPFRNKYIASKDHPWWDDLMYLVDAGAMDRSTSDEYGFFTFQLTDAGCYLLNIPGADSIE